MSNEGLTNEQAQVLLAQHGENKIVGSKPKSALSMFFAQFKDFMIVLLAAATVLSIVLGEGGQAIAIIVIVFLNALMGFVQQSRTERTLNALKELSSPSANVMRGGTVMQVRAADVVPGDYALVEEGDRVAADIVLAETVALSADEALLTGESLPVQKEKGQLLYMGTSVAGGRGGGRVVKTGMGTQLGGIAALIQNTKEQPTPLQKQLEKLGIYVALICVITCAAVALLGYLQGKTIISMVLMSISLAVAAIPEGLPAVITIVLSLATGRMLKKNAIIRRMHAVETLGCASVICTDKTGTVTENKMTVKAVLADARYFTVTGGGYEKAGYFKIGKNTVPPQSDAVLDKLLLCGALCATARIDGSDPKYYTVHGDPTETAVLIAAAKGGVDPNVAAGRWQRVSEVPFNSARKMMSVVCKAGGETVYFCKGATDVILPKCKYILGAGGKRPLTPIDKAAVAAALKDMADGALRVIAFAYSEHADGSSPIFLGLMGMIDPPRKEAAKAVAVCRKAGIKPVMITGDHVGTAVAIAKQVGIFVEGDMVLTGDEVAAMHEQKLEQLCMNVSVYARVSPSEKLKIVKAYKAHGQVTAMTGDGVNDAPAIKAADIGVAMGKSGTDVTKEAASVVVADDNFATIVSAVEEGRVIYQNIKRFIRYLLTCNLGEVLSIFFCMVMGLPAALLPLQILVINLLTDGLPAIALGMEPAAKNTMAAPPRKKNESIFAHGLLVTIVLCGILLGATVAAVFALVSGTADIETARSAAFLTMVLAQMVHVFECRARGAGLFKNPFLLASTFSSAIFAVLTVYIPFFWPIFNTAPVLGQHLKIVAVAVLAAPLAAVVINIITRILFSKKS